MKSLDGRAPLAAALACALIFCLAPAPSVAQDPTGPGSYAADPDTPPYLAPKPRPLRGSYVEPLAPPEPSSPGKAQKARKAKKSVPAAAQAPAPRQPSKPALVSQPKPKPRPHRAAKPAQPAQPPKASKPAKPAPRPAAVAPAKVPLRAVQQALTRAGYPTPQDGKFNKPTRRALRNFQRDHRLPVTGQADRATLLKLGLN